MEGLREWSREYELEWPEDVSEDMTQTPDLLQNNIKALSSKRDQIEKQLSSTYDLLEQGIYSLSTFKERREVLEKKKADIHMELNHLQQEHDMTLAREQANRSFIPAVRHIADVYWSTDDVETKNAVLKEVLDRVEYRKTERTKKGQRESANFTLHIYPRLPENR